MGKENPAVKAYTIKSGAATPGPDAPRRSPGAPGGAAPAALGITTIFTDEFSPDELKKFRLKQELNRQIFDEKTGEFFYVCWDYRRGEWRQEYDSVVSDLEKWILQRKAADLLAPFNEERQRVELVPRFRVRPIAEMFDSAFGRQPDAARKAQKQKKLDSTRNALVFRVPLCHRSAIAKKSPEIWKSRLTSRASFHNVGVCGSVWTCTVCSPKINRARQDEIAKAYEAVIASGGAAYMLTFTCRHGIGDDAQQLVDKMKQAHQLLQKSNAFKQITRREPLKRPRADSLPFFDYIGRIAGLETTYGKNGFHPHEHHLWFFKRRLKSGEIDQIERLLFNAWSECCQEVGLPAPRYSWKNKDTGKIHKVGLDMRIALSAAEYMTKIANEGQWCAEKVGERRWGVEKELAGAHVKKAGMKGRTPFQLLYDAAQGDEPAGRLFQVFAHAFKGRHQLQFSDSLKKFLDDCGQQVDESEAGDLAHAASKESQSDRLGELTLADWRRLVQSNAHGMVLRVAAAQGFDAAVEFIRSLPSSGVVPHFLAPLPRFVVGSLSSP